MVDHPVKRALIITYYWPPSGGAGVQRWLKFVKYFRDFGWEPVIYTPDNPEHPVVDHSLEKDLPVNLTVLKTPITEPYNLYRKITGRPTDDSVKSAFLSEKPSGGLAERMAVWIRGNFFIPDARFLWIRPSVKFLLHYLKKNPCDLLISTGPPHSMHLIARKLKKKLHIPWIADFRDPWTQIDYYHQLRLTLPADCYHHFLEKKVLKEADRVVVVSPGMKDSFNRIVPRTYHVITNGYDEEDIPESIPVPPEKFVIAHFGSLPPARNPDNLWRTLGELLRTQKDLSRKLQVRLVGNVDWQVRQSIKQHGIEQHTEIIPYLPHQQVIQEECASTLLLLVINQSPNASMILTGKLFEYLASGRPILCIGPENGDAASILRETRRGTTVDFDNTEGLKRTILEYFEQFSNGLLNFFASPPLQYSRRELTRQMTKLMNEVLTPSYRQ